MNLDDLTIDSKRNSRRELKRNQLLDTAQALFVQHGIRKVSVEEICRKAGISKATFYKFFDNRNQLALSVLNRMTEVINFRFEAIVESKRPFTEQLAMVMELDRSSAQEMGPALLEDIMALDQTELQNWMLDQEEKSKALIMRFFERGQASGVLNRCFTPEFFLYLFEVGREMFQDPRFKVACPDVMTRGAWLYDFLLYGLMAPPPDLSSAHFAISKTLKE